MVKRGEKVELKETVIGKINHLSKKSTILDWELYTLTKDFFKEYLQIQYEYTHDELMKELNKVYLKNDIKSKLFLFLKDVGEIEYKHEPHSQEELKKLLHSFRALVHTLIKEEQAKENKFQKLLKIFSMKKRDKAAEAESMNKYIKATAEKDAIMELADKAVAEMQKLIEEMDSHLSEPKSKGKAKETYKKLLTKYNSLHEDKKKDFYQLINEYYHKLSKKK